MATSSGISLLSSAALCVLLLSGVCLASEETRQRRRYSQQREWRIERLEAAEPSRKVQAEAGTIEYWDQEHEQFQGAGVAPYRTTVQPRGLLLPFYSNSPRLSYVIQGPEFRVPSSELFFLDSFDYLLIPCALSCSTGNGIYGSVFPGCPETFQQSYEHRSESRREERREEQQSREEHQKVHRFREGDVIALPAGVASWFYNDGEKPVVVVTVADISNSANQLDQTLRVSELNRSPSYLAFSLNWGTSAVPEVRAGGKRAAREVSGDLLLRQRVPRIRRQDTRRGIRHQPGDREEAPGTRREKGQHSPRREGTPGGEAGKRPTAVGRRRRKRPRAQGGTRKRSREEGRRRTTTGSRRREGEEAEGS